MSKLESLMKYRVSFQLLKFESFLTKGHNYIVSFLDLMASQHLLSGVLFSLTKITCLFALFVG